MKINRLIGVLFVALFVSGCSNQNAGTAVGAASGALIGSASLVGAGVGLGIGALAGGAIGAAIDKHCANPSNCNDTAECLTSSPA